MNLKEEIADLKSMVERNIPIGSLDFLEKAVRLNLALIDVDDELVKATMEINQLKAELMLEGKSSAYATTIAKATESFRRVLQLEADKDHAIETVRLAKKRVELLRGHQEGYEH